MRAETEGCGSPLFALTWKHWDMPWGPPICALRASARRTSDSEFGSWPTPNTPSGGRSTSIEKMDATGRTTDGRKHTASLEHAVKFAAWPTPCSQDGPKGGPGQGADRLPAAAALAPRPWATPMRADGRGSAGVGKAELPNQAHGVISSGSPAETEKPGQLHPAFSLWLQGYGIAWARCAEQVTPSSRKSRKSSSVRIEPPDEQAA